MRIGKDEIDRQIDGALFIIYNLHIAWKLLNHKLLQFRIELMGRWQSSGRKW